MDIFFESLDKAFIKNENIENIEFFNQFVNWLEGEFDLYLMEESDGLKVYFPNGFFWVTLFSDNEKYLTIEIKITSTNLKTTNQMALKIDTLYNQLKKVFKN